MYQPQLFQDYNYQTQTDGREHLEELKNRITWNKGERILDIGCGPGDFTVNFLLPFAPDDAQIVGADVSKEMIQYAQSTFDHPRVSFREIDIEREDIWHSWQKESFSKIHSLYCFHWLDKYNDKALSTQRIIISALRSWMFTRWALEPESGWNIQDLRALMMMRCVESALSLEVAENLFNLLKPGGEMFHLFLGDQKTLDKFNELITSYPWINFLKGKLYFQRVTSGSIEDRKKAILRELNRVGFKCAKIEEKCTGYSFSTLEDFWNMMISVNPYRRLIPDDVLPEYDLRLKGICQELAIYQPEKGVYTSEYTLFALRARK